MADGKDFRFAEEIQRRGLELGCCQVGIAQAGPADPEGVFERWIDRGYHAGMAYMARRVAERKDPRKLVPGARSVVAVAVPYFHPRPSEPADTGCGKVSCYAWGRDYHRVVSGMLRRLKGFILERRPDATVYAEVDTGPVLERFWAERAGIGWIGKNGCLIVPGFGSYVFLGILITDLELDYDEPAERRCGKCTKCLEACPTGAIVEPGLVDAGKCISYWTVEHRGDFADEVEGSLSGWVFGCDLCQEACPWNRKLPVSGISDFAPRPGIANPDLAWLAGLSAEEYERTFRGSTMRRAKVEGLRRNARAVLGSEGGRKALP